MKKGNKHSEETKKKMGESRKRFYSDPNNKKMLSEARKKQWQNGFKGSTGKHWNLSEETKQKQSMAQSREKNGNWRGGTALRSHLHKTAPRQRPEQCEICGAFGKIELDHDHKTGKFRGWLCHRCNWVLGLVKDNFENLLNLAEYLQKNN